MNQDEMNARLIVLETFVMTTLGLYLANSKNDPDYSKATAMIDYLRAASVSNASAAGDAVHKTAHAYADYLASMVAANLRQLRGEGGLSH
jgi:hypothetical protein